MSKGVALSEVLLAAGLMLMLLVGAAACCQTLQHQAQRVRQALEPRQQIRQFFLNLRRDLRAANHVFAGFSGRLQGETVTVPAAGAAGDCLLWAQPLELSPNPSYQVCLVLARPRSLHDPNNPEARELLYHRYRPLTSSPPGVASALLPHQFTSGSSRVFDAYLPPGPYLGDCPPWSIRLAPDGRGVRVMTHFYLRPARGQPLSQRFDGYFSLRNR